MPQPPRADRRTAAPSIAVHPPAHRPIRVTELRDSERFPNLAGEWNALVRSTTDLPFYRHEFLVAWLRAFGASIRPRILLGREARGGRLIAALPLMERRTSLRGMPIREITTLANAHSCRSDLLAARGETAARAFLEYLASDPDWDVLRLIDVPEDGKAHHLYTVARAAGFPTGKWESQRSPYLDLPSSEEELGRRLSKQLQSLVRRRRRQLAGHGDIRVERVPEDNLVEALEEFFAIEMRGWKGGMGTACAQDGPAASFYTLLADAASRMGGLSLFALKLGRRTIAFHYGLTYGDTYYLPKLGYDETFREMSPGLVLMDGVVKDAVARGLGRCDLLGSDDPWKMRWSTGVLRHHWLYIFRDSVKGRLLKKLKFDWTDHARRWGWTRA